MTISATAETGKALTAVGLSRSARYRRAMESLIIRDEHGRLVPMTFSPSQEIIWAVIAAKLDTNEKIWLICLKSRQTYMSTLTTALLFIRTLEQNGTNSLVLAQDLHTSHQLFTMAKRFYDHLPLPKIKEPRVTELEFQGASRYHVVSAGTMAKGRGTTQSCVHGSECAFWPHPEILDGLFQAMPDLPNTMWILESTANGMTGKGELFFNLWNAAVRGESDLTPIFIPWFIMVKYRRQPAIHPDDYDKEERMLVEQFGVDGEQLAWRRRTIATKCRGSVDIFHQEYPSSPEEAFIASGQPAFDMMGILEQRSNMRPPIARYSVDPEDGKLFKTSKGEIRVWKEPESGHQYVIGADTAEGLSGGDYSCGVVLDMASLEQVASVHGHIQYHEFAQLLNALGRWYNTAILAIEVYPQGFTVQDKLIRDHHYPNLHRWLGKPDQVKPRTRHLYGWECVDPEAKILTADLRWVPARMVKTGDQILGCEEASGPGRGVNRRLRVQTVTQREVFVAPRVEVVLDDGRKTRVSTSHPFLVQRPPRKRPRWIMASDLRPGDILRALPVWDEDRSYDAGRLSAFLDGEGHLAQGKQYGFQLLITQAEGPLAQEIRDLWAELGYDSTFKWLRHKTTRPQHWKTMAVSGVIRLPEVLRALGSLRPSRLLRRYAEHDIGRLTVKSLHRVAVQEVRDIGEGPVIGLTTDPDHTLIADGIIGHNTNVWSRPLLIAAGQRALNHGLVVLHEDGLLNELMRFSKNDDGKYEASVGHDDRVLALLIALRSREENYYPAREHLNMSEPTLPHGVRIVGHRDVTADGHKRVSDLLRRVKDSTKHWMQMGLMFALSLGVVV